MKRMLAVALIAAMLLLSGCCIPSGKKETVTTTVTTTEGTQEATLVTTEPTEGETTTTEETTTTDTMVGTTSVKVTLPYRTTGTTRRTTTTTRTTTRTSAVIAVDPDLIGEYMTTLINRERAAAGVSPLQFRADLQSYADTRALEISQFFSHTRPNGTDCFTVFDTGHHYFWAMGENIAYGQQTVVDVMDAWMSSDGHRENILNDSFNGVAVGCKNIDGVYYWVQLFVYE